MYRQMSPKEISAHPMGLSDQLSDKEYKSGKLLLPLE